MNIEVMVYIYMVICSAMILFNCVMVVVNGRQKDRLERADHRISPEIPAQIHRLKRGEPLEEDHLSWMEKKLRRVGNLRALDADLESLGRADPAGTADYLEALRPVFLTLAGDYCQRDPLEATYFAYVVRKYRLVRKGQPDSLTRAMLGLLTSPSVYARENALHILYDLGDPDIVVRALRVLDEAHTFHHPKLIHDGLLSFAASREDLLKALWQAFPDVSHEMQTTLVNYMRLSGGGCSREIFALMTQAGQDDEVYFACMRYFGRFPYPPAYPILLEDLRQREGRRWELAAVAATVLSSYPGEETVQALKGALHSPVWYVRANAAESLEILGVSYEGLVAIFEGEDRYAREILQYRMDYRKAKQAKEKEAALV